MNSQITEPLLLNETGLMLVEAIKGLSKKNGDICYAMHINFNESDPSEAVTYLRDAVGLTPAHMDYDNDIFNYGSWENTFFMPRPCMVKTNGKVDYYLNPNDFTKKINGEASDIANIEYDGNAMMEWGKDGRIIYMKISPDAGNPFSCTVYIANYKEDDDFKDYNFRDNNGAQISHFYTAIYNGSLINDKLRSLSGQNIMRSKNASQEMGYAQANGTGYNIEVYSDRLLINMLLILMGKSLDTQTVFGAGVSNRAEVESSMIDTGTMNTKGLFWGNNDGTTAGVKVFGMENYWGNQWRRLAGWVNDNGTQKVKLTHSTIDGSTATGYNLDGAGYIVIPDSTPTGTSVGYISKMITTTYGLIPVEASGSSTTFTCDGLWFNNGQNNFAVVGGYYSNGARVGALCVHLDNAAAYSGWALGVALSYKPPISA